MPYFALSPAALVTLGLVVFGLLVLAALAVVTYHAVRRGRAAQAVLIADITDRRGLLTARVAALRVAVAQRFGRK